MTFLRDFSITQPTNFVGRVQTADEKIIFDAKHIKDKLPILFDENIIGTGTSVWNTNRVVMSVAGGTDSVIRKTFRSFNYISGVPINFTLTCSRFESEANVTKRCGAYTSTVASPFNSGFDGVFLETTGTQTALKVFRNGVQLTEILKTAWLNGADSIDLQFGQVFKIQYLWLGYGGIQLFADVNGKFVLACQFLFTNVDENPFFDSPNKPIRYEIVSSGGAGTFNQVCSSVSYESNIDEVGTDFSLNTGSTLPLLNTTGVRYIVAAFQLKSTHLDMTSIFKNITVMSTSNDDALVEFYYDGTPSAALPFTDISASSNLQRFIGTGTLTQTLGAVSSEYLAHSDYVRQTNRISISLDGKRKLGSRINGTPTVLYVCVTPLSAALTCSFSCQIIDLS